MLSFFFSMLFTDFKKQFSGHKLQLLHLGQDLLVLFVLYQTSEAFSQVKVSGESLFGHLLFGEIILRLPSMLIFLPTDKMRPWVESGALEYMLSFEGGPNRVILLESLGAGLAQALRSFLLLGCVYLFLPQYLDASLFLRAVVVQVLTLPIFIVVGLSLMPISLYYRWGRSMMGRLIGILGLLSGGYFPLSNFNEYRDLATFFNPLALYVNAIKSAVPVVSIMSGVLIGIMVSTLFLFSSVFFNKRLRNGQIEGLAK